jgi:uncharacterized glyoxalase superfamily protein PhnB
MKEEGQAWYRETFGAAERVRMSCSAKLKEETVVTFSFVVGAES